MNYNLSIEEMLKHTEHMVLLGNQKEFREQVASFLRMHCLRVKCINSGLDASELPQISMIAVASSGSGKTYVTSRLAKAAGVRVITIDCSSLTRTGWRGVNLGRLIDTEYKNICDKEEFETCVIHFDEFDKLRFTGRSDSDAGNPQPDFLKMFDGEIVCESDVGTKRYNTTRMAFLFTGAFNGLEDIVCRRLSPGCAIGFSSVIDSIDTTNVLSMVTTEDLYKYGIMKELLGRIGLITHISKLTESDFKALITKGNGSICNRYNNLFKPTGVTVDISEEACLRLAAECSNSDIGARAAVPIFQKYILAKLKDVEKYPDINKIQLHYTDEQGYCVMESYGARTYPKASTDKIVSVKKQTKRLLDVNFAEMLKRRDGIRVAINEMMRVYTWTEVDEFALEFDLVRSFLNCVMLYFKHHCREEDQTLYNVMKLAKTTTLNENGTSTFLTIIDNGLSSMNLSGVEDRTHLKRARDRFVTLCSDNDLTSLVSRHICKICSQWYLKLHESLLNNTN